MTSQSLLIKEQPFTVSHLLVVARRRAATLRFAACERFEKLGVEFVKKPDDGKMKGLAFIKDPDGYWIEILQPDMLEKQRKDS